jgi:hypothetical protein
MLWVSRNTPPGIRPATCNGRKSGGEEVLVGVAVAQDHRADTLAVCGGDQLAQRPAGVVADERRTIDIERPEDLGDDAGQPRRTEVGIG